MSKERKRKSYKEGYSDSQNAKPIDDFSKGMGELFGGMGCFKTDEEKSYDKGWEDGAKRRHSAEENSDSSDSISGYGKTKSNEYSTNSHEEFSYSSTGKSYDKNEEILYYPYISIKIGAILIGVIIIFYLVTDPESFLNTKGEKSYASQLLTLLPGRMYEISWNEVMARPFEVEYGGKKYKTYNYFIENENGKKPLKGNVFDATIYNPWKIHTSREIQFRILFTKPAILSIRDVTGKIRNTQLNEDVNIYEKFKNY